MTRRDLLRATVGALVAPVVGLLPKSATPRTWTWNCSTSDGRTIKYYADGKLIGTKELPPMVLRFSRLSDPNDWSFDSV
jgi:hypothetical protein